MEGLATDAGTREFFLGKEVHAAKRREFDGLALSTLGIGTCSGAADDPTDRLYEDALSKAPSLGVNAFDTAIHYREGRSEKILGKALQKIPREQVFVSTKGGVLHEERTDFFDPADLVLDRYCLSPSFIQYQIEKSLENLNLKTIDLYLIQNPEMVLGALGEEEFFRRLELLFLELEKKVEEGKIVRYGIASWNGFRQKPHSKGLLNLFKIVELAKKCGGEKHRFKAIQLPYNLVMMEALKTKNQEQELSILEAASVLKIAAFASAPLMQGQIKNLTKRVFERLPPERTVSLQGLEFVLSTPGIQIAFAGMKNHLEENSELLVKPNWPSGDWETLNLPK